MRGSGQNILAQATLQIQVLAGTNVDPESGRGIRWSWTRFLVERGEGEQPLLLLTPSKINVANVADLSTTRVRAIGR